MSFATRLSHTLGIRSSEAQTVQLFFLHHFLLGIGTMLIYVSANLILLENHPETSLPLAYMASAVGMLGITRLYAYVEHHWLMSKLVVRVLIAVMLLTILVVVMVAFGHSVAFAVAIMVAYRGIYLLSNLEFWGISALIFDVRQSKRLFGVISSGDMPAKALGAILAALIHGHTEIIVLLLFALFFFGGALITVRLTIRSHDIHTAHHNPTRVRSYQPTGLVKQLFGGSKLIFALCLSLLCVAGISSVIEYAFFVNVKQRFHDQALVMKYLGYVLATTYLLALFVKLIVSQRMLERWGLLASLRLLPFAAAIGILLLLLLPARTEQYLMVFFCLLYLVIEVLRRAIFDPIFLVLFQPLPPSQRLHSHTLAKGTYEGLGMGIAGVLLYLINLLHVPSEWLLVGFVICGGLAAVFALGKTYKHYLLTLKEALARRFLANNEVIISPETFGLMAGYLRSAKTEEVSNAIDWLGQYQPELLAQESRYLLRHPDSKICLRALEVYTQRGLSVNLDDLQALLQRSTSAAAQTLAATKYCQQKPNDSAWLSHPTLAIRKGAVIGHLQSDRRHPEALRAVEVMGQSNHTDEKTAALEVIKVLKIKDFLSFTENCLQDPAQAVVLAALDTLGAIGQAHSATRLVAFLDGHTWQPAARSLVHLSTLAIPPLTEVATLSDDPVVVKRIIGICHKMESFEAYKLLIFIAQRSHLTIRKAALDALSTFPADPSDEPIFQDLLKQELKFAQRLIAGESTLPLSLQSGLSYEKELSLRRILLIIKQIYNSPALSTVLADVMSTAQDRQANSLELLDNSIPRPVYASLQTLIDDLPTDVRVKQLSAQLGSLPDEQSLLSFITWRGDNFFSDWTLSLAIREAHHDEAAVHHLPQYFFHPNPLLRESVLFALRYLQKQQIGYFTLLTRNHPEIVTELMQHPTSDLTVSLAERVIVLKNTPLFAETPEGVLSSVAPIMQEVRYDESEEIFKQGTTGNCMFVIYRGEVGIYDGTKQLAVFGQNDVFGELALLDTEARSGTAVAHSDVLLFRIEQADFYELMEERSEVLRSIIRILCQRLRVQNRILSAQA